METEEKPKTTRIQDEIVRLQGMCDKILLDFPESESAASLARTIVPDLEPLRAKAKKEHDSGGITEETYSAVQAQMTLGHNVGWDLADELPGNLKARIITQQWDHIHVLMNESGIENPHPPESHKCFPPGSEC